LRETLSPTFSKSIGGNIDLPALGELDELLALRPIFGAAREILNTGIDRR